jgi:hypothetical protein
MEEEGLHFWQNSGLQEVGKCLGSVWNVLRAEEVESGQDLVVYRYHVCNCFLLKCLDRGDFDQLVQGSRIILEDLVEKIVAKLAALDVVLFPNIAVEVLRDSMLKVISDFD